MTANSCMLSLGCFDVASCTPIQQEVACSSCAMHDLRCLWDVTSIHLAYGAQLKPCCVGVTSFTDTGFSKDCFQLSIAAVLTIPSLKPMFQQLQALA